MRDNNWTSMLDEFGKGILRALGHDPDWLSGTQNAITDALAADADKFLALAQAIPGFSRTALSRVATICQMAVYDHQNGPENDGKRKALRRHWYAWYKTAFAQPLAFAIGDVKENAQGIKEMDDLAWTARLSETYAAFVDSRAVTYEDLWVEDASRMHRGFWNTLFDGCHILVCVEKDSLFEDFANAAQALGAQALYSGKGKSSKAGIERILRQHFNWPYTTFTERDPLILLHISDYDFDGEAVIGPTFGEQSTRYADHILEARVGVQPEGVIESGKNLDDVWYQIKLSNSGYRTWASDKGLWLAQCCECGTNYPVVGIDDTRRCPNCGGAERVALEIGEDTAHGLEVESLPTRRYYRMLVDALLSVLPFEYIVDRLRDECVADPADAARTLADDILGANASYQRLLRRYEELAEAKETFERMVQSRLTDAGRGHENDWRDDDDDPEPDEFRRWVENAQGWAGPWRPFEKSARTAALVNYLREEAVDVIDELIAHEIEL